MLSLVTQNTRMYEHNTYALRTGLDPNAERGCSASKIFLYMQEFLCVHLLVLARTDINRFYCT